MTPFAVLLNLSGMTQRETALFLGVSPVSIDKMARGQRSCPAGILREMQQLIMRQETTAAQALDMIVRTQPPEVELGYPADDYEAQQLGWPSRNAWAAMAGRVVAASPAPVILVPRGSTPGTAAAADSHGL